MVAEKRRGRNNLVEQKRKKCSRTKTEKTLVKNQIRKLFQTLPWPHLRRHQGPAQARVPCAVVAEDDRELLAGAGAPGRGRDGGVARSICGSRGKGAAAAARVVVIIRRDASALVNAKLAPSGDVDLAFRVKVGVPAAILRVWVFFSREKSM